MNSFQHILANAKTLRVRTTHAISICVVVALVAPALSFSNVSAVHAATNGCSTFASTAPQSLCIESSSDGALAEPYITGVKAGDRITKFNWLINADNTGNPAFTESSVIDCLPASASVSQATADSNPAQSIYLHAGGANAPLPANETSSLADCPWPSVHMTKGHSDVVASGNEGDISALANLEDGSYLVSVTSIGYKIDGVHFTVVNKVVTSVNDEADAPFIVTMNPLPKKTTTLRVHVYNDNASTNGQWDGQTETLVTCLVADGDTPTAIQEANCPNFTDPTLVGDPLTDMSGFSVRINDVLGMVTADVYGNPLCTQYQTDGNGNVLFNNDGTPNPIVYGDGGTTGGSLAGTESTCLSDHYGDIVIPNLGPNRYAVSITPPDPRSHDGVKWVQTTTLEGGHDWDSWNIEGGSGYDTELIVGGERVPPISHGFVRLTHNDNVWNDAEAARPVTADPSVYTTKEQAYYDASSGFDGGTPGFGVMTGVIMVGRTYIGSGGATPLAGLNLANAKEDGPIADGVVSISCLADCSAPTDQAVWTGRARSDGTFRVTGLQTGDYSVAFWDESQNHILAVLQYHVDGDQILPILPRITKAERTGTSGARKYTLTFVSKPTIVGGLLTLSGGDNGWNGNFSVLTQTSLAPWQVTVVAISPTTNPNRNASAMPQATSGPAIFPAALNVGHVLLLGWFSELTGVVFNDLNGDGAQQAGEPGIPNFTVGVRTRGNSLEDQGSTTALTNEFGQYDLSQAYPLNQFLIVEAYNSRFKNTGATYTTDNDPVPHTIHSSQVDYNFLPVIGLSANMDFGVRAYGTGSDYWSGDSTVVASKYENGGIAGTVTYDVTRNEFDPAYSVQEDYQPGIPGISMQLWKTKRLNGKLITTASGAVAQYGVGSDGLECSRADSDRGTNAVTTSQSCKPHDYYVTETWTRPTGCTALDVNGNELQGEMALPSHKAKANVDWTHTDPTQPDCIEAPMSGFQIGGDGSVNGNYALTSLIQPNVLTAAISAGSNLENLYAQAQNNPAMSAPLVSGDYIVEAVNPVDRFNTKTVSDANVGGYFAGSATNRLYRFTSEMSVNVFTGDTYVPNQGYAGTGSGTGGGYSLNVSPQSRLRSDSNSLGSGVVAKCAGTLYTVPASQADQAAVNQDFADNGGTPFAGRTMPICDAKLVTVSGGRSMPAGFSMYTEVPLPTKFYGLLNDDLNVQVDRRSIMLGEVAPVSNAPVGIYDELGRWKFTAHSDVNGFYEVILPSVDTYNCPLPAGPCPNVYRLVGNDPGTLSHRNLDYNPQFRTISTNFQAWPGVIHPVDQAPTHIGITIEGALQYGALSLCSLGDTNPTLYAIDKPYYDPATDSTHTYVIKGVGFGAIGRLALGNTSVTTTLWNDNEIHFQVPNTLLPGGYQLSILNTRSTLQTINAITFHKLSPNSGDNSNSYFRKSDVYEVNPDLATDNASARIYTPQMDAWDTATDSPAGFDGTSYLGNSVRGGRAIQRALEAARSASGTSDTARAKLVVVFPNTAPNYEAHNPFAAYFENVIVHSKVMIQGVGPGGARTTTNIVLGSTIDASQYWSATQITPVGGNQQTTDGTYSGDWRNLANSITRTGTGPQELPEGAGVTALAETSNQFGGTAASTTLFKTGVDGFMLTGGDQQGNPGNVNTLPGTAGAQLPRNPGPAQGGAIMLDQYVRDFNISNNQVQSNGGTYGTVRIGTPDLTGNSSAQSNHNDRLTVAHNRFVANGGTALAGALGLFAGADNYNVNNNDFCGNFSAEYGGAISHYGLSNNGSISRNRIYYNQGYDEGGGIMIAGALPANTSTLSRGSGAVTIDSNTIISNQSNDDGGGIRYLMAGNFHHVVQNNIIANNLAAHAGGGVAIDDAPDVTLANNTIVKNVSTGTAATNGAMIINSGGVTRTIKPANPAGLATGPNSSLLQKTLSVDAPKFSNPVLINNIFADNRAGWAELPTQFNANTSAIHGVGDVLDSEPIQRWDMGVVGCSACSLSPFNSFLNTNPVLSFASVTGGVTPDASNIEEVGDGSLAIGFVNAQDFAVDSLMWRTNTNVSYPVIVARNLPFHMLTNYHILLSTSPAVAGGNALSVAATTPTIDIDGDKRITSIGADEWTSDVDMSVGLTTSSATVSTGDNISYTVTARNIGTSAGHAAISFPLPIGITGSWACSAADGATCPAIMAPGDLQEYLVIPAGGSLTFTFSGVVSNTAQHGAVTGTATITPAVGLHDIDLTNNEASVVINIASVGNLSITASGVGTTVAKRAKLPYVVRVSNNSTSLMSETLSIALTGSTSGFGGWSCVAVGIGSTCSSSSGTGDVNNRVVTVAPGGSVTYTYSSGLMAWSVSGSARTNTNITLTARLTANVSGYTDTNSADNTSTIVSKVQ
ncbi:MAG: hypothetical protein WCH38_00190 [Actinomycetota bacterium]